MIKNFCHKGLKEFWETGSIKGIPAQQVDKLEERLTVINAAKELEDINLPNYCLHQLKGSRKNTWAVKITGNYRITFKLIDGCAYDINYEDYH